MALLTGASYLDVIFQLEAELGKLLVGWKQEGLDEMQAVQHKIAYFHFKMWITSGFAAWYFILSALLIFVVYRTRKLK